ncbi:uncharacterized protein C1orf198 homolog [Diachasma alloeum]|uniref:uncharacterized protein C1orf198 homolog n=1 Tax=Diachasma alloeum TaxID=454923 RepID=UPI0007383E73|nr:uncharacterized protein C1orf198 homolog [Diachasma alloeum]
MTNNCKSLSSVAEDYFHNLNPLARRIADDIEATKEAYEGLWGTLSLKEKNQAIDETIIQPEIALQYAVGVGELGKDMPEWYPRLRIQTGLRHVIDETGSTLRWKDEHSGPFSFMTRSQMDLSLFAAPENPRLKSSGNYSDDSPHFTSPIQLEESSFESSLNEYTTSSNPTSFYQSESYSDSVFKNPDPSRSASQPNDNIFTKMMSKTSFLKMGNSPDDEMESLVPPRSAMRGAQKTVGGNKVQMNINLSSGSRPKSGDITESTALLETPSSYSSFQSAQTNQDEGIPKTGFEFLDNW